jgi:hypothetical protein
MTLIELARSLLPPEWRYERGTRQRYDMFYAPDFIPSLSSFEQPSPHRALRISEIDDEISVQLAIQECLRAFEKRQIIREHEVLIAIKGLRQKGLL